MVSSFLVFWSSFCSSSWCQLTIPKLYLSTGTASDPVAWILFFALIIIIIIIIGGDDGGSGGGGGGDWLG